MRYSGPSLPEDIWHHIHSLLNLRDAALVACVSRSFRRSWRCFPNLTINRRALGLEDEMSSSKVLVIISSKTKHILENHDGVGVKKLRLQITDFPFFTTSSDLERWLHKAVRPGIEELGLGLVLHSRHADVFGFPCALLLDGSGKSIRHLNLRNCAFRPMPGLYCLTSLTSLDFSDVHITGDELSCLLSSSVSLVKLRLVYCNEIILLEIPSLLQRLSRLDVTDCKNLEVIESKAPNLYYFRYTGAPVRLSLGDSLQNFKSFASSWGQFQYACENLPHIVPNLEALDISSYVRDTLVVPVPGKFLHLQRLCFEFISPDYDYISLVPFLDACPSLETFKLFVAPVAMEQESILLNFPHDLRQIPGHLHGNIKDVQISGFCSAKSLVELTCHILENARSLKSLTLNTSYNGESLCFSNKSGKCPWMGRDIITEAHKTLLTIETYIVGKVPSSVGLKVVGPCSRCNSL